MTMFVPTLDDKQRSKQQYQPCNWEDDLFSAVRSGKTNRVLEEITARRGGKRINDAQDVHGNTVVHVACQNNNKRILKYFLRNGARLDAQNMYGNSPLHFCFMYEYNKLADYLILKGANDSLLNMDGLTAYETHCTYATY